MRRVLVANRGEIALRVARACRVAGLETVALYGPGEEGAPHVAAADLALPLASFLDAGAILDAARTSRSDAVHPGYGFLAENPAFAEAVESAGLVWIGPPPAAIAAMGSKVEARSRMERAGVPVVPGTGPLDPEGEEIVRRASGLGYPVFVKAVAGGGGKGMRLVERADALPAAARACRDEATRAFGDGAIYLEKALLRPRHVEVQVLADAHGRTVSLFERECSVQRRHQKIIEESPSPAVDETLRREMGEAAVAAAEAVGYRNAGTVEFLLEDGRFHMLEMNTRLQVEHPVTEAVTGLDLVLLQLTVAAGEPLPPEAVSPSLRGHAVECRVYAEDPAAGFLPATGTVLRLREPRGPGVRVDSALAEGLEVGARYDPMLAKVVCGGPDRVTAVRRALRAVEEFVLLGVTTNLEFLAGVLRHPAFRSGDLSNRFVEEHMAGWEPDPSGAPEDLLLAVSALAGRSGVPAGARGVAPRDAGASSPWRTLDGWRLLPGRGG